MRTSTIFTILYVGLIAAGITSRPALADETPKRIATFEQITGILNARTYAWVSENQIVEWNAWSPGFARTVCDTSTGKVTPVGIDTKLTDVKSMEKVFADGLVAWRDELWDKVNWMDLASGRSGAVTINASKAPVWWRQSGRDRLVVLHGGGDYPDAGLIVTDISTSGQSPNQPWIPSIPEKGFVANIAWPLGCTSEGVVLAIGYWEHPYEKFERLISVDLSKPDVHADSHSITPPRGLVNVSTTLCGNKIVWLLKRSRDRYYKSEMVSKEPASHFEIWKSKMDGTRFSRILKIDTVKSGKGEPTFDNEPQNLQTKPDGTAVSYLQGDSIYLVRIK